MYDNRFTWMHSGQLGASQMDGVKLSDGQMLAMLDSTLVDGFNPRTPTLIETTPTSVTFTFAEEHGYELRQLIAISGADDTTLNGRHRLISKTRYTITLSVSGVTQTSGTIVAKVAPLGFESMFGNTVPAKRAYRSKNMQGTRTVLFLDATLPTGHGYNALNPAKRLMVSLCENMTTLGTEINSYSKVFTNKTKNKNGSMFWYQARPTAREEASVRPEYKPWVVVGNGDIVYIFNEWQEYLEPGGMYRDYYAFGDVQSLGGATDQYNCIWMGAINANDADTVYGAANGAELGGDINTTGPGFYIKSHTGVGSLERFTLTTSGFTGAFQSGYSTDPYPIPAPNPVSHSLVCFPIYTLTPAGLRGRLPKIMAIPQNLNSNRTYYDLKVNENVLTIATYFSRYTSGPYNGFFAIDLGD